MIRSFTMFLFLILHLSAQTSSQVVTGRIVDENITPITGASLELYATPNMYTTVSDSLGYFNFHITITGIEDDQLPSGYAVTNNFPNPFNPTTRIGVTLPARGKVTLEVFNMLGETVTPAVEETFSPGTHYMDVELNGLSNGIYFSRITIDDKIVAVRKMVLVYGSQHLNTGAGMPKSVILPLEIVLDSLVVITSFGSKTFTNLPSFNGDTLDLGNLVFERWICPPTIVYEGRTYNTVQIGEQCWLKENLNVGIMISGTQEMESNGIIEKYCYGDDTLNCISYGALYQWDEAMQYVTQSGSQGICPPGWHIPTREEYERLIETVDYDGNALKAVGQGTGNGAGTNLSGYTAKLSGRRYSNGTFGSLGNLGIFWASTEYSSFYGIYLHLYNSGKIAGVPDLSKKYGFCVRCIKDSQ